MNTHSMNTAPKPFALAASLRVLLASFLFSGLPLFAQETPEASLQTLQPAEGLHVSLWASEPMVNNPTSMEIDSRGRVWITEGLNYRMKQKEFENLKRVAGADRIKVLADTDGDGRADKVTVFAENIFPVPMGLAIEEIWTNGKQTGTRVYIGNSPNLLVLEDTDGDDKADRQFPLLTGFRGIDSDHGLHGMTFGPDGKLYFTVGDARYGSDGVQARDATFDVTDRSGRRVSHNNFGTTLRVNRDGTDFVVLSSGHRNNYETAVDSFGNVFGSDNDDDGNRGSRMYWVMKQGNYGYHHPDSDRHWAEEIPGIIPKLVGTGNGAPAGLIVYEGAMLPKKFRGAVLQIDSGTHQINSHKLYRHGGGFRASYDVLMRGKDPWFRPVDLSVAPDGSVFVCDWYDAGVGANRFSDQTTGRIFRIDQAGSTNPAGLPAGTPDIEALRSPNVTARLAARDRLLSRGADSRSDLQNRFRQGDPIDRARVLHVLYNLPNTGIPDTIEALGDSDPRLRELAIRLLTQSEPSATVTSESPDDTGSPGNDPSDANHLPEELLTRILALSKDSDAGVRRVILEAIRDLPTSTIGPVLQQLAADWDGTDRYYLEALRAALVNRESGFVRQLIRNLGEHAVASSWNNDPIALPPFYPIGSNDAFLRPQDQLPPSNEASRVIGLIWSLRRADTLPILKSILEMNQSPSVEHAAMIAVSGIPDLAAGELLLERYASDRMDVDRQQKLLTQIGAGLAGSWSDLKDHPKTKVVFTNALQTPGLQAAALEAIDRGKIEGFGELMMELIPDESLDVTTRAVALTSLGSLKHAPVKELALSLVQRAKDRSSGGPLALAALEAIQSLDQHAAEGLLAETLTDTHMPLDMQRRALQRLTLLPSGVDRTLELRSEGVFPKDLASELSFLLHNHADYGVRQRAIKELPIESGPNDTKIHDVKTVLALQGDVESGRQLFHNHKDALCSRCHHVTGEGTLVGPDLASVGLKYGGKELLYHIQYPSGGINYNFVAHSFLLDDGRLLNGLVVDRKEGQITIGIATGQLLHFAADEVEEERPQSVSLMPEGLVANLSTQELADLIEYLLTLRQGDRIR